VHEVARVSKLLNDKVASSAELGLKKLGKYGIVAGRLQIIIAAKKHGITDVCRIHGISRTTLTDWIRRLGTDGTDALENKPKIPRSPLTGHEFTIKTWIEENHNITVRELLIKTTTELGITVSQTAMRRVIKNLNFSYITPRPCHHKQDKTSHTEFKKKSSGEASR
jgi:transposase